MSFKQLIDNNAVIFFLAAIAGAFSAGIGSYEAVVRMSGRAFVSSGDLEKAQKYEGLVAARDALQAKLATAENEIRSLKEASVPTAELAELKKAKADSEALAKDLGHAKADMLTRIAEAKTASLALAKEQDRNRALSMRVVELQHAGSAVSSINVEVAKIEAVKGGRGCPATHIMAIAEVYMLKSQGNPSQFVAIGLEQDGLRVSGINKPGDGVMEVTDTGWIIRHCSAPGWKSLNYRRFMNIISGATSELVPVKLDIGA
ncbi:hypothetical protein [Tahibacter sp.]|uniref:hypothetical protein n=1 Tax=Tahibacter sp. TaxID=2056211 RepID=UPI0028C4979A|nr:hypothetical protein [Tahibacter sp.]